MAQAALCLVFVSPAVRHSLLLPHAYPGMGPCHGAGCDVRGLGLPPGWDYTKSNEKVVSLRGHGLGGAPHQPEEPSRSPPPPPVASPSAAL